MASARATVPTPARSNWRSGLAGNALPDQPKSPGGAPAGGGLVPYTTSQTDDGVTVVNTVHGRLFKMAQRVRTAARLHSERYGNDRNKYRCFMVTLTYAPGQSWNPKHISNALQAAKTHFGRRNREFRYAWVAELQLKRMAKGASARQCVHYHVLCWLPMGCGMPQWDRQGWWHYGMTNTLQVFAPVKYAVKYTSKGSSDVEQFPRGARICGSGGLSVPQRTEARYWAAPRFVREQAGIQDNPQRCKGGFLLRSTGEFIESPWVLVCASKGRAVIARKSEGRHAS